MILNIYKKQQEVRVVEYGDTIGRELYGLQRLCMAHAGPRSGIFA